MGEISIAPQHGISLFIFQDPENAREIKPYQTELDKCFLEDVDSVMKSVTKVRGDLESLKVEVSSHFTQESYDCVRKRMFDMEGKIRRLKEVIKEELHILINDVENSLKELQFLEKRIGDWGKPLSSRLFKPLKQSCYKINSNNGHPTSDFQKFLSSSGGHYGGWPEQDHLLFLRERKKYKVKEKFISVVHALLPDYTYEDIAEHANWYIKYESLKNSQREAIQKWKLDKTVQQQEKEKAVREKEVKKSGKKTVCQQRDIAERIKRWKNEQMMKKLAEIEKQKREKEKLKEEERKRKEILEMKKSAIKQFKADKLSKVMENKPALEEKQFAAQEMKARNSILLKAFRLQDARFIEKKKIVRLQVESKSERLRLTKPAIEVILRRDPQRLFQPTLIWSQHCQEAQKREKTIPVFNLNAIPRLAIPEWRRELKWN